jgi:purine-binding chemotaxis protein CheW
MTNRVANTPAADAERINQLLEERARALAREPQAEGAVGNTVDLLVLALGPERYGVDILQVQTIQALSGLTRLPGLPAFWAGLVNLRGRLYPVLNLRRYLALPGQPAEGGKVVLATAANLSMALWVDDVLEVRRVPLDEIGAPLADTATAAERGLGVRGITADLLIVLDLDVLLGDPRLVALA